MKKIMFNDKYGLTKAVLDGSKTQTRRVINQPKDSFGFEVVSVGGVRYKVLAIDAHGGNDKEDGSDWVILPKYKVGEVVAIAQSYNSFVKSSDWDRVDELAHTAGWKNKMFVKAKLMPYQIEITNIRVERLQRISDEDCLKESGVHQSAFTPRENFACLIDNVSGKGTWNSNHFVWVYDFKLIKR